MITTNQVKYGKTAYHVISLHEPAEKVILLYAKMIHCENRFYVEYAVDGKVGTFTDINTAFTMKKPAVYE